MRELRSELVRLRRRELALGWFGLTALSAVLINTVMFQLVAGEPSPPANGPGVTFPTAAALAADDGLVAGLAAASSIFGVVTLTFWALAAGTDYSSGLIRLLASAQPHRWRLVAGKVGALAAWTAVAALVALVVSLVVAPIGAEAADIDTSAWGDGAVPVVLRAWLDLFLALLVWGVIGLALAIVLRSAAVAIGVGIGYVLVVEGIVRTASASLGDWLPGSTIHALAHGGSDALSYGGALALGALYVALGLTASIVVLGRRDITD